MMRLAPLALGMLLACALCIAGPVRAQGDPPLDIGTIRALMGKLRPLQARLGRPAPADWLAVYPEPGQSFNEYLARGPILPTGARRTLVLQQMGDFTEAQRQVVALTAEFLTLYYGLPVRMETATLPLDLVPATARRHHPTEGVEQLLSTYIISEVLTPRLPDDAAAYMVFTTSDLWPGDPWGYVFGQASLVNRVGVWSLARSGDPAADPASFRLCLLRTLKTATHEVGHMWGMRHCTAYQCGMNGSNLREENDRRPLALCPECEAKVWWITHETAPATRYRRLAAFCRAQGLTDEAARYDVLGAAVANAQ